MYILYEVNTSNCLVSIFQKHFLRPPIKMKKTHLDAMLIIFQDFNILCYGNIETEWRLFPNSVHFGVELRDRESFIWEKCPEIIQFQHLSSSRVSCSRLPRTMSSEVLSISKDSGSRATLGSLFQWLTTLTVINKYINMKGIKSKIKSIFLHSDGISRIIIFTHFLLFCHWALLRGAWLIFVPSHLVLVHTDCIPPGSLYSTLQLHHSSLIWEMLHSINHFSTLVLDAFY